MSPHSTLVLDLWMQCLFCSQRSRNVNPDLSRTSNRGLYAHAISRIVVMLAVLGTSWPVFWKRGTSFYEDSCLHSLRRAMLIFRVMQELFGVKISWAREAGELAKLPCVKKKLRLRATALMALLGVPVPTLSPLTSSEVRSISWAPADLGSGLSFAYPGYPPPQPTCLTLCPVPSLV